MRRGRLVAVLMWAALAIGAATAGTDRGATLPAGFQERIVPQGLPQPTAVRFANDGRVFVAEERHPGRSSRT